MRNIALIGSLMLAACVSMQEHDVKPYDLTFTVQKTYQAVYADTLRAMRQCLNPGNGYFMSPVSEQMSAELYPDLGYGEITRYQANMVSIPWSTTRIERRGVGTLVSIKTSSKAQYAQRLERAWLAYWAKGGRVCPKMFEMPPGE